MDSQRPNDVPLPHPLAPLSEPEFCRARDAVIKLRGPDEAMFFRSLYLEEPPKAEMIPFLEAEHAGSLKHDTPRPRRRARAEFDVIGTSHCVFTCVIVDVETGEIVSRRTADGEAFPSFTPTEFEICERVILDSPLFKEAMASFSLPDGFRVVVDPWPYGGTAERNPRYMQGLVFAMNASHGNNDANHYAYPVPILPVVDWVTKKVIRVDRLATGGVGDDFAPPSPPGSPIKLFEKLPAAEYVPELLGEPLRDDLKPLNVVQPSGPSFTAHADGLVEWMSWRFRISFNPREGAVIHDLCYQNRPIAYRLSFSELTVPYADPREPYTRKQAFDFGDGGVGRAANNLQLGCDCLGAIHYMNAYLVTPQGSPMHACAVVCLHEEDAGVLWKHTNFRTGRAVVVRSRELVVQFICTLANYEYVFAYKLDLAGGVTLETRATGIVSVVAIDEGKRSDYGNVVSPGVLAQNHQHIFCARIDPAIDSYRPGDTCVVIEESRSVDIDPDKNPCGNAYSISRETVAAARWVDKEPRLNRTLRFESTVKRNDVSGNPVGYRLVAPATQLLLAAEDGVQARRAPFARHDAWVTGFRDGEFWPAGEFTNQSHCESGGVEAMVRRADRFVDGGGSSPVVWSVYGLTHNPRVEDWPVMPVETYQLHLRPADFFTKNPALNVPSTRNDSSVLVSCCDSQANGDKGNQEAAMKESALSHRQGSGRGVDAEQAGAHVRD
ncbi:hypothetical protein L249_0746 [Ophiocordyceps polyrhachis-furcata BCC 54312]|uniref:Amine oxidase n=1 Tax=Ophiocordyceps polyrhachis-furcata BCC 54312 TaxID=1330021 RepID=A0A367LCW9_9HYPO|nr:hypothetical protein L249_0746 [Ophiocordyceps polyrhachis-furcata BCC 54312]